MLRFNITITAPDLSQPRRVLIDRLPLRLGRAPENDLAIPYSSISGHHLAIDRHAEQGLLITDLGSTNGTRLADKPLTPHHPHQVSLPCELRLGDVLLSITPLGRDHNEAFTCVHSETQLRELVDDALRHTTSAQDTLPFFEILSGPGSGRRLPLDLQESTSLLGTSAEAQIRIDLPELPPQLAEISWHTERLWLTALTPDLLFESQPLSAPHPLQSGQHFIIGAIELLFFDPLEDAMRAVTTDSHQTLKDPQSDAQVSAPEQNDEPEHVKEISSQNDEDQPQAPKERSEQTTAHDDEESDTSSTKPRSGLRLLELIILAISVLFLFGALGILWFFFNPAT